MILQLTRAGITVDGPATLTDKLLESIRRIDDDVLRSLRLIPGAAALLVDHAAVVHRHAIGRHGAHHRADDGRRHGDGRADRRGSRDRVIVVVPAVVAAAVCRHSTLTLRSTLTLLTLLTLVLRTLLVRASALLLLTCAFCLLPPPPPAACAAAARAAATAATAAAHGATATAAATTAAAAPRHRRREPWRSWPERERPTRPEATCRMISSCWRSSTWSSRGTISIFFAPLGGVNLNTESLKVGFRFQSIRRNRLRARFVGAIGDHDLARQRLAPGA